AYLQAKKHAAEEVLAETQQKSQEDDTLLERKTTRHAQASKHMQASISDTVNSIANETEIDEDSPLFQATHEMASSAEASDIKTNIHTSIPQLAKFSIPT